MHVIDISSDESDDASTAQPEANRYSQHSDASDSVADIRAPTQQSSLLGMFRAKREGKSGGAAELNGSVVAAAAPGSTAPLRIETSTPDEAPTASAASLRRFTKQMSRFGRRKQVGSQPAVTSGDVGPSVEVHSGSGPSGKRRRLSDAVIDTPNYSSDVHHRGTVNEEDMLLADKYAPVCEDDLAVHIAKVKEVKDWLSGTGHCNRRPVLVVSGPPGCGKSATLRVCGEALGTRMVHWEDPRDQLWDRDEDRSMTSGDNPNARLGYVPRLEQFRGFLLRTQRYSSISLGSGHGLAEKHDGREPLQQIQQVAVVDELPLVTRPQQADELASILRRAASTSSRHRVVFLLHTADLQSELVGGRVFSRDFLALPGVEHVSFNPINNTLMKKAIKRVCEGEGVSIDEASLKKLVEDSNGDLSHALTRLDFSIRQSTGSRSRRRGSDCSVSKSQGRMGRGSSSTSSRRVTKRQKKDPVRLSGADGKDSSRLIFHSASKLLFGKRSSTDSPFPRTAPTDGRPPLMFSHAEVLDKTPDAENLPVFLHSQVPKFFDTVDDMHGQAQVCDDLALGDTIGSVLRTGRTTQHQEVTLNYHALIASMSVSSHNVLGGRPKGQCPMTKPDFFGFRKRQHANARNAEAVFAEQLAVGHTTRTVHTELAPFLGRLVFSLGGRDPFALHPAQRAHISQVCSFSAPDVDARPVVPDALVGQVKLSGTLHRCRGDDGSRYTGAYDAGDDIEDSDNE